MKLKDTQPALQVSEQLFETARAILLMPNQLDSSQLTPRVRQADGQRSGLRRPVFPVHPLRGLDPGRRPGQVRQLQYRPGRGGACGLRRKDRLCLFRRHFARGTVTGGATHARHRARRARPRGAGRGGGCRPQPVSAGRSAGQPARPAEGSAAGTSRGHCAQA